MGNDVSCCGTNENKTRSGGRVTYDGKKKKHMDEKKRNKMNNRTESLATGKPNCPLELVQMTQRDLEARPNFRSANQISKSTKLWAEAATARSSSCSTLQLESSLQ